MYDIGRVWSDWRVVRLIGEGSFGKVYEIVRNNFGIEEHSALKVIQIPTSQAEIQSFKNEGMDDKSVTDYYLDLVNDFIGEIAVMSQLRGNPGIVEYEDYSIVEHENEIGWDILIKMELLTPITQVMRNHVLTEQEVIELGIQLCDALSVCHKNNIIHRDIKLDNIFVSKNGFYKLGDFGVARTIEKTSSGMSKKGTYTYMAPEVYRGEPYGSSVDIYSLGMVMYRLLNFNREPFVPLPPAPVKYGDKNEAIIKRMQGQRLNPPCNAGQRLGGIILQACSFKPEHRFRSAEALKNALLSLTDHNDRPNPNYTNGTRKNIKVELPSDRANTPFKNDKYVYIDKTNRGKTVSANVSVGLHNDNQNKHDFNYTQGADISDAQENEDETVSANASGGLYNDNQNKHDFNYTQRADISDAHENEDETVSANASGGFYNYSQENHDFNSTQGVNTANVRNFSGAVIADRSKASTTDSIPYTMKVDDKAEEASGRIIDQMLEKKRKVRVRDALSIGWIGMLFNIIIAVILMPFTIVQVIVVFIIQIIFTQKVFSKEAWVVMLIACILSLSLVNIVELVMLYGVCFDKE